MTIIGPGYWEDRKVSEELWPAIRALSSRPEPSHDP